MLPSESPSTGARPASVSDLFWSFTRLAMQGFGGVLAVVQRELVDKKKWLTQAEFIEDWAVAQILPGPNVVNLSLMLGDRPWVMRARTCSMSGARLRSTIMAGDTLRTNPKMPSSTGELCKGRKNSMPCAAASSSMATMYSVLRSICWSLRAAKVAMLTWSSWLALVGRLSTLAGWARDLFSEAYETGYKPSIIRHPAHAGTAPCPPQHAQRTRIHTLAGKRVPSQSSTTRATPNARCSTKP